VAPDISSIGKGVGERCRHLDTENRCGIYDRRPDICRCYRPDEICRQVFAPTLEERVDRYRTLFSL
jgi:Fe-S-cluster containining protein